MIEAQPSAPLAAASVAQNGWYTWRRILVVLAAAPLVFAAIWAVATIIVRIFLPGCQVGPSNGSCVAGSIDLEVPLAVMGMPMMVFAFIAPVWAMFVAGWILYGLVPAAVWWLFGHGFVLHRAFLLQGEAMRLPRLAAVVLAIVLYSGWWITTP